MEKWKGDRNDFPPISRSEETGGREGGGAFTKAYETEPVEIINALHVREFASPR